MNFECLLLSAKAGNEDAITAILQMYRPLLLKYARIRWLVWRTSSSSELVLPRSGISKLLVWMPSAWSRLVRC